MTNPASASALRHQPWLCRFAVFTAGATLVLICFGGLVTSHGAGLAVPDWPNTYGYNQTAPMAARRDAAGVRSTAAGGRHAPSPRGPGDPGFPIGLRTTLATNGCAVRRALQSAADRGSSGEADHRVRRASAVDASLRGVLRRGSGRRRLVDHATPVGDEAPADAISDRLAGVGRSSIRPRGRDDLDREISRYRDRPCHGRLPHSGVGGPANGNGVPVVRFASKSRPCTGRERCSSSPAGRCSWPAGSDLILCPRRRRQFLQAP